MVPRVLRAASLAVLALFCISLSAAASPDSRVRQFALQRYYHGVPYREARALGPESIPVLREMLLDASLKRSWPSVVTTIAYIGTPESFSILKDFMWDRFSGVVDDTTFQALLTVPNVMGTIPDRPGVNVIDFLESGTNPGNWDRLPWKERVYSQHQLSVLLSAVCINGLACVQLPRAAAILQRLRSHPYTKSQLPNIREGILVNQDVRKRGLAAYIEDRQAKGWRLGAGR